MLASLLAASLLPSLPWSVLVWPLWLAALVGTVLWITARR